MHMSENAVIKVDKSCNKTLHLNIKVANHAGELRLVVGNYVDEQRLA